jgi:DNA helicase-2/ATP-dependent DNA helicase PcrA
MAGTPDYPYLASLNAAQRAAACYGVTDGAGQTPTPPLLIIAGAGTGKTNTLAHRVAHLLAQGAEPSRICLLTFTRRAAAEMIRRAERIVADARRQGAAARIGDIRSFRSRAWAGTFHAVANRLLRMHAEMAGLDPSFTVLDRSDSADLMNLKRTELQLHQQRRRFPRKDTCLSIYSRVVNTQSELTDVLDTAFPWCAEHEEPLRDLFRAYVQVKIEQRVLDYDDLLLYWHHLCRDEAAATMIGDRFDHVLVDEYQDTNRLQSAILHDLKPTGAGLTVVGDDAQSIYAFRAADIENILRFPEQFQSAEGDPARVITLEENYRSTPPIIEATNAVISASPRRYQKDLRPHRAGRQRPRLVTVADESAECEYIVQRILAHREAGIALKKQAVLMRTAHHSDQLEVFLGRHNIPFVKYGGLKFLEAAHVKDIVCTLRWAENPRDHIAAFRVLLMLPGIGPTTARRAIEHLGREHDRFETLSAFRPPAAASDDWQPFCGIMTALASAHADWRSPLPSLFDWYDPHLERMYESPQVRRGDLESLERLCANYPTRERFLTEVTLDPPEGSGDEAGVPHLDEDYLILSTIHSAKGQEWDIVYVLHAADGCIPSDMSTGTPESVEEERRVLYVAMTRARDELHIVHPLRFFVRQQHRFGDRHVFTPLTRFLPRNIHDRFEITTMIDEDSNEGPRGPVPRIDVASKIAAMWT